MSPNETLGTINVPPPSASLPFYLWVAKAPTSIHVLQKGILYKCLKRYKIFMFCYSILDEPSFLMISVC